jgi:hypothetical protein
MNDLVIEVDKARLAQIQWAFRSWPQAVTRILKESINRTAFQCRTRFVRAVRLICELKAGTIRKAVRIRPATNSNLSATVALGGRLHAGQESIARGTLSQKLITASGPQSMWLYKNVFQPKYGEDAIFSWHYKIRRIIETGHGWVLAGRRYPAPRESFIGHGRGGTMGIFQKNGTKLEILKGPSIAEVVESAPGTMNRIKAETFRELESNIDQRVGRFLVMMHKRGAAA